MAEGKWDATLYSSAVFITLATPTPLLLGRYRRCQPLPAGGDRQVHRPTGKVGEILFGWPERHLLRLTPSQALPARRKGGSP
jgi:hypothetical protein